MPLAARCVPMKPPPPLLQPAGVRAALRAAHIHSCGGWPQLRNVALFMHAVVARHALYSEPSRHGRRAAHAGSCTLPGAGHGMPRTTWWLQWLHVQVAGCAGRMAAARRASPHHTTLWLGWDGPLAPWGYVAWVTRCTGSGANCCISDVHGPAAGTAVDAAGPSRPAGQQEGGRGDVLRPQGSGCWAVLPHRL